MEPTRKFKIIVNSKECGTCSGSSPSAVAKKVVKKLCGNSSKAVRFSLKECKRGCERVCGPYQGRMEKLDRPYTRSGKKITHRVVCGKVKKMRGGDLDEFLNKGHVEKNVTDKYFKIKECYTKGSNGLHSTYYVFLGNITLEDKNYYEYIIYAYNGTIIIIYKLESLKKNNINKITGLNYIEINEQKNINIFNKFFNSLDKTEFLTELKIIKNDNMQTPHYDNLFLLYKYFNSIQPTTNN